jgi:ABC-type multidrug transport system fused ATPase/permease subunit
MSRAESRERGERIDRLDRMAFGERGGGTSTPRGGDSMRGDRELLSESLRGRRRELILFLLWSAVEALPALLTGRLLAAALDHGFLAGNSGKGFAFLAVFGLSVLVGSWGTRQALLRLAVVIEPFRDELVRRTVRGALRRAAAAGRPAEAASVARLTQQVEIVREAYATILMVAQGFVVSAGAAIVGFATLLPAALPLVVGPVVAGLLVFALLLRRLAARQRDVILADEQIAESAEGVISGLRDVFAAGGEETVQVSVGKTIDTQAHAATRIARMSGARTITAAIGGWLPVALILISGPSLVHGGATPGDIVGALAYVLRGVQPAVQQLVASIGTTAMWLFVTLRRIAESTEDTGPARPAAGGAEPRDAELRLESVTFAYSRVAEPVVAGLSLTVPDGDHLAIVGPSGVGKSTLANLIAGILRPGAGRISLGGTPLDDLDPEVLARHRALIPQETFVLRASVRENLVYLREDATDAELEQALEALGATALVDRLGGLGAQLDPAVLSGADRQLLTLARAYMSPARLVILDEASSELDAASEARVEAAFRRRPGTLIVIAHRISSALRARRVMVLDGTRVAVGTHEALLEESELYRDLTAGWHVPTLTAAGARPVPRLTESV